MKPKTIITGICCLLNLFVYAQLKKKTSVVKRSASTVQFILTSDVHFGLIKENFRGQKNIPSSVVNAAMIDQMNKLPAVVLPNDSGVNAGKKIRNIGALIITGDIANRAETGVQPASVSWNEFIKDYTKMLHLKNAAGKPVLLLLSPGNHDVSNTVGFHRMMTPLKDASSMIGMYNLEIHPAVKRNSSNYNYSKDKIHYTADIGGIHFMFVNLWPDSAERIWMTKDLASVKKTTTVLLFTHSMPDVEARFFVNPNGMHDINDHDKFENLLSEQFKDGYAVTDSALNEQRALVHFLKIHRNIKAWFHGHSNYTEYYDWKGPDNNILLHCFRADSPMKGKYSARDETKLSFEVISIDIHSKKLTARECLWNNDPTHPENMPVWGASRSVSIQ